MILLIGTFYTFLNVSFLGAFFVAFLSAKRTRVENGEIIHPNYAGWAVGVSVGVGLCVMGHLIVRYGPEMRDTPFADQLELAFISLLCACPLSMLILGLWVRLFKQRPTVGSSENA